MAAGVALIGGALIKRTWEFFWRQWPSTVQGFLVQCGATSLLPVAHDGE